MMTYSRLSSLYAVEGCETDQPDLASCRMFAAVLNE